MRQIKCLWCDSSCSFFSHCLFSEEKTQKRNETPAPWYGAMNRNKWDKSWITIFFLTLEKQFIWDSQKVPAIQKLKRKKRRNYLGNSIYSFQFVTYKSVRVFRLAICFSSFFRLRRLCSCFFAIKHGCKHVMQLAKIILRTMRFKELCDKLRQKSSLRANE